MSDDYLSHFGVKGMHWGVHKDDLPGVSSRANKEARKDAVEFARAKAFYGNGAGVRRKLIKGQVEGKSNTISGYKAAFDHHLALQNPAEHVDKAIAERHRKNAVQSTAKTARGVKHVLTGNSKYASLAATLLVGGAMAAHKNGIDAVILKSAKTKVSDIKSSYNMSPAEKTIRDLGFKFTK